MEVQINECNCCGSKNFTSFMNPKCFITREQLYSVKCNDCNFIFLSPRPDPKKGEEYFNKAYLGHEDFKDHEYYRDHEAKLYQSRLKVEALDHLNLSKGMLLDVGAGQGHFMKAATDTGWQVVGTEISSGARESAKKLYDIELKENFSSFKNESFDVITLWDVLEHVFDVKEILKDTSRLLKPGGRIVIETVNIDSVDFLVQKERWHLWNLDHNYYFSLDTLTKFLTDFQYSDIQTLTGAATTKKKKRTIGQVFIKYVNSPRKIIEEINRRKLSINSDARMGGYTLIISATKSK